MLDWKHSFKSQRLFISRNLTFHGRTVLTVTSPSRGSGGKQGELGGGRRLPSPPQTARHTVCDGKLIPCLGWVTIIIVLSWSLYHVVMQVQACGAEDCVTSVRLVKPHRPAYPKMSKWMTAILSARGVNTTRWLQHAVWAVGAAPPPPPAGGTYLSTDSQVDKLRASAPPLDKVPWELCLNFVFPLLH